MIKASERKFNYARRTTEKDRGQAGDKAGDCQPADTDGEATPAQEVQCVRQDPLKLLSDNGSGYIAKPFNLFLEQSGIHHIYRACNHSQASGKK